MHPNDGRVVTNFIMQALQGQPITIFGDGEQTRSSCYVDDLVEAFLRMMETGPEFPGPINLGNPNEFSILELVLDLTGSKSRLERKPPPEDDPRRRQPDIKLARERLDWEPKTQLREGLTKTIKYFDQLLRRKARAGHTSRRTTKRD